MIGVSLTQVKMEAVRMLTDPPTVSPGHYYVIRRQLMSSVMGHTSLYIEYSVGRFEWFCCLAGRRSANVVFHHSHAVQ